MICPYPVNIKKLSFDECEKIINDYFEGYIPKQLIQYKIREIQNKEIFPYGLKNMQKNNPELYDIVSDLSKDERR